MDFDNSKPIYLQIVDLFYENILLKRWPDGERIPSVRELAVMVEVNPNTAIRSFNHLQELEVIHNKRGIGYFVSEEGYQKVLNIKRKEYLNKTLPDVFKKMEMLELKFEDLEHAFNDHLKNLNHEKK